MCYHARTERQQEFLYHNGGRNRQQVLADVENEKTEAVFGRSGYGRDAFAIYFRESEDDLPDREYLCRYLKTLWRTCGTRSSRMQERKHSLRTGKA